MRKEGTKSNIRLGNYNKKYWMILYWRSFWRICCCCMWFGVYRRGGRYIKYIYSIYAGWMYWGSEIVCGFWSMEEGGGRERETQTHDKCVPSIYLRYKRWRKMSIYGKKTSQKYLRKIPITHLNLYWMLPMSLLSNPIFPVVHNDCASYEWSEDFQLLLF